MIILTARDDPATRSRGSRPAPTTTSASPSTSRSCSRGSGPACAATSRAARTQRRRGRRHLARSADALGLDGEADDRAERPGVRAAADLPRAPGPGPHPRAAPRERLGLRLRPGLERRRRLRRLPAPQARLEPLRDRARRRVSVSGVGRARRSVRPALPAHQPAAVATQSVASAIASHRSAPSSVEPRETHSLGG